MHDRRTLRLSSDDYDLRLHATTSSWSVRFRNGVTVEHGFLTIEINGQPHVPTIDTITRDTGGLLVRFTPSAGVAIQLAFFPFAGDSRFLALRITLENVSSEICRIGALSFLRIDPVRQGRIALGSAPSRLRMYCHSGGQELTHVRPLGKPARGAASSAEGELVFGQRKGTTNTSVGFTLLHAPEVNQSLVMGFGTVEKSIPFLTADLRRTGLSFAATYTCDGFELLPRRKKTLDDFILGAFEDGFHALETYATAVQKRNHLRPGARIPTGWADWVFLGFDKTQCDTLDSLKTIRDKLNTMGLQYTYLTTSWNDRDLPGDWLKENRRRFPRGLRWMTRQVQRLGMSMGHWTAPIAVTAGTEVFEKHPLWIVRDSAGRPWVRGIWTWQGRPNVYTLDWTHPEVRAYLARVYQRLNARGVKWLMVDFTGYWPAGYGGYHQKALLPGAEAFRYGRRWIMRHIAKDIFVTDSSGPTLMALGLTPAARIAADSGVGDDLLHLRNYITSIGANYFLHRRWWINDPDYFTSGGGNSLAIDRARFVAVALSGGVALVGGDLPYATEDEIQLMRQLFPPYGQAARPVDLFENEYPRLWRLNVDADWDKWQVWGSFNLSTAPVRNRIPVDQDGDFLIWDFWEKTCLGIVSASHSIVQPPASASLIGVRRVRPYPWPIATDLHYTQGGVELTQVRWKDNILSGRIHRPAHVSGKLFIHVPKGYVIQGIVLGRDTFSARRCRAYSGKQDVNIAILPCSFTGKPAPWKVIFKS